MKVVALISGGKDSCYAMMKCIEYGHEIVALANLKPSDDLVDELDSFMYQTVGHQVVASYAECMGVPLFQRRIQGFTRHQYLSYKLTPGDEVEDMFILLNEIKVRIPSITAVSSGAIASNYQRLRVESVCSRLGLVSLAYLWKQDQSFLLQDMVAHGVKAIMVKVATIGLDPAKHLGKEIAFMSPHLHKLKGDYGINICGEGGEYETLTLDCPLFVNAQIKVDEFKIILHSSNPIAPVGVLHPVHFYLEKKDTFVSSTVNGRTDDDRMDMYLGGVDSVFEVQGDCSQTVEAKFVLVDVGSIKPSGHKFYISRTKGENTYSLCCWLRNSCKPSGKPEDLELVLKNIELQLMDNGLGWENVLYIHLYIDDMNDFALSNEIYVRFITHEKCHVGVPSRSTIQLPLLHMGLGQAYVEVLVSSNLNKNVLHVQSISCWAPSCIGPYSQATLHKGMLLMAGQLGLIPATMCLSEGGIIAQLKLALENCEAVASCFNCSISTSAIQFVIYCSTHSPLSEKTKLMEEQNTILMEMRHLLSNEGTVSKLCDPISLYILVPDLPKRALVEVKPILYMERDLESGSACFKENLSCINAPNYWGFHEKQWHEYCYQRCVIPGKLCALIVHITNKFVLKICSESVGADLNFADCQKLITEERMERIARFCIYLLHRLLIEEDFLWEDVMNLRVYYPTDSVLVPFETLYAIFSDAFNEFGEMSGNMGLREEPIFNLIPVLALGKSSTSLDDLITCELLARKE